MNQLINTDNYESFYLDYLEGNLTAIEIVAFEQFLAQHPDLIVDEETIFPVLETENGGFDSIQKLTLKQTIDIDELSAETLDFFLIAQTENQLSELQNNQLEKWLSENPTFQEEQRHTQLVFVKADTTLIFEHKKALLQRESKIIPLYYWVSGAVAASLILFFSLNIEKSGQQQVAQNKTQQSKMEITQKKSEEIASVTSTTSTGSVTEMKETNSTNKITTTKIAVTEALEVKATTIANLPHFPIRETTTRTPKTGTPFIRKDTPNDIENTQLPEKPASSNDYAWTSVEQMENPIKPITSRLSDVIKTPIDVRRAKATKKKSGGFFVKIGKFEVSHTTASL